MGMVPNGVVQYTMGTILYDSPEHDDIIFLGEILQWPSSHSLPYDLAPGRLTLMNAISSVTHFLVSREGHEQEVK